MDANPNRLTTKTLLDSALGLDVHRATDAEDLFARLGIGHSQPGMTDAIEGLYKTFSRYPRPAKIEFCPCGCTKPDATAHLVRAPLPDLRFADLADYFFSAISTQGSVDDFRYLLPRLLQGIAEEAYGYNPEILFGKLSLARWSTWPNDEIAAVRAYLHALWITGLTSYPIEERLPAFFEIETLLASIARTGEALEAYLNVWGDTRIREADEHLVQFVAMYGSDFADGKTFSHAFWAASGSQALDLRDWLLQSFTLDRIARAAHLLRDDGLQHLFEPALATLRIEARRRGYADPPSSIG